MYWGQALIGFGFGVLAATFIAVVLLRRHLRRTRAAERRARTAERLAEIGAMTGGLAHEIKNPLSTIGLNAQLLMEAVGELDLADHERSRLMNRAKALHRETDRLAGTLRDFLEFAGKVQLDPRPTDVNTLVEELIDFYLPEAERQGVRLRADLFPRPLVASVDGKFIKQALLNLMLNATQAMVAARRATGEGGARPGTDGGAGSGDGWAGGLGGGGGSARAGERVAVGSVGELILKTEPAKEPDGSPSVRIHVIDTGPGIPPEIVDKIFEPYFTTKGAASSSIASDAHAAGGGASGGGGGWGGGGGSGLGLPTSRRLVQEHGGRLEVHSEVGKGSDFTVTVPMGNVT